jgi:hypothetical protein
LTSDDRQRVIDEEHLRLLALFHYISGGVTVAFASIFGFMLGMMSLMFAFLPTQTAARCASEGPCANPQPMPEPLQHIFLVLFALLFILVLTFGILEIVSGRYIAKRKRRVFSLVVSVPRILAFPYGTMLSIFTLLVLDRKTVKELYREASGS